MNELPAGAKPRLHDLARLIARWLYRPAYRLHVRGLAKVPRTGPVVVIANHLSMIEPQLIFGLLPRRSVFLVKDELYRGLIGVGLRWVGQLPVRRGEPDRRPLLDAVRVLKSGGVVALFPEGSRGLGEVQCLEPGAAWLVRTTGAVVVPIGVRGTRRPESGRKRFRPRVDIEVGEPFSMDVARGKDGLVEAAEVMRTTLAATVAQVDAVRAGHDSGRAEQSHQRREFR